VRIAKHKQLDVNCAIKTIDKRKMTQNDSDKELMENELSALEKLTHPNIVRVYELLHDQKNYYIVSEVIADGELNEVIESRRA